MGAEGPSRFVRSKVCEYFKVILMMKKCNILRTAELSRYFGDLATMHSWGVTRGELFGKVVFRIRVFSETPCRLKIIV